MSANDIVQIVTAIGVIFTAVAAIVNRLKIGAVKQDVKDVHTAVNNTAQKQNRRVDQLTDSLTEAGVDVPPRDPPEGDEAGA